MTSPIERSKKAGRRGNASLIGGNTRGSVDNKPVDHPTGSLDRKYFLLLDGCKSWISALRRSIYSRRTLIVAASGALDATNG